MNRKLTLLFTSCCLLAVLSSCNSDRDRIVGHYFSDNRAASYWNPRNFQVHSFLNNAATPPTENDAVFVDFFKDGTYVMNFHSFEHGEYTLDEQTVYLHCSDGTEWSLRFLYDTTNQRMVFYWPDDDYLGLTQMEGGRGSKYPFTLDNNRWRILPGQEGAPENVIERLQQHLSYIEKVMIWSNQNKTAIRFQNLPGPLKVVGNGFEVKGTKETPEWCVMAGEGDCEVAATILTDIFRSGRLRWRQDGNQLERLLDVVRQINRHLEDYQQG